MPTEKTLKPFGLWTSPITSAALSQRLRLDDLAWDSDGQTLVWVEGRSDRSGLVAQCGSDARRDLSDALNVRGGVGYGGGLLACANGQAYFPDSSGRLFSRSLSSGSARAILPAFGGTASPTLSPDGNLVLYVFSDGSTDLLGMVDAAGKEWPLQVAKGADFYMQPAWHPSGRRIAWVEWDHPNMPWDGTRIQQAWLGADHPRITQMSTVAGGPSTPVAQPIYAPDGRWLAFIETAGEWEQLVLLDLENNSRKVLFLEEGAHLMSPAWIQGLRSIAWNEHSSAIYAIVQREGSSNLWRIGLDGRKEAIDSAPYTTLAQLTVSPVSGKIALLASAPTIPSRIVTWDGERWTVVARSDSETTPAAFIALPQPIAWNATDGAVVHGLYYPPANPNFYAAGAPPAIFNIHGGPTSAVMSNFNAEAAYFSSRGYSYIEVNYRGSSGYGRSYLDALKQHWGDYDVEDTVSGAAALAERGLVDGKRLIVKGGSAGGYTVLNCLVRYPGRFKAAICLFGVSNLFTLDLDTHKFEAHYTSSLVGELPEAAGRYRAWSPVFHSDKIRDPLYIFQGSEDKVVPPSQSEEIVAGLQKSGATHQYKLYAGEGHGFRKSENIADYLKETERFLMQQVLFSD